MSPLRARDAGLRAKAHRAPCPRARRRRSSRTSAEPPPHRPWSRIRPSLAGCAAPLAAPANPLRRECCWSPGQKNTLCAQVPRPAREKTAIAILKYASGGPVLSGMHPMSSHVGWLARHPTNGHLYAACAGRLISLRIAQDGSLRETSSADALGNPAHFELSSDGAWVLVANYAESNVVVLPILPDGTVGDAVDSKHHALSAPNPALRDRQESSHPHQVRLDPRGEKWALVPDLGADRVWVYGFDAARGSLLGASNSTRHLVLPAGAGPRHLDFHPNGRWVYVLCELDGKVAQPPRPRPSRL